MNNDIIINNSSNDAISSDNNTYTLVLRHLAHVQRVQPEAVVQIAQIVLLLHASDPRR